MITVVVCIVFPIAISCAPVSFEYKVRIKSITTPPHPPIQQLICTTESQSFVMGIGDRYVIHTYVYTPTQY